MSLPERLRRLRSQLEIFPRTMAFLVRHPLTAKHPLRSLARFATWQLGSRLVPGPIAVPFVGNTRLLVHSGMAGATGNVYAGLHELSQMGFVLHALRPDDLFIDIGANVGVYTVLAGAAVGASCIAFEPLPVTFARLLDNVRLNDLGARVTCHNCALGRAPGSASMTTHLDSMNHVADAGEEGAITVPVRRLDDVVDDDRPRVVKIDVEGFEPEVLAGGTRTLASPQTRAIVLELDGSGGRYGSDSDALHREVTAWGFEPVQYDPMSRSVTPIRSDGAPRGTIVYVRDVAEVKARVAAAPRRRVLDAEI
jgi:FkbM family methyltransferase